MDRFQVSDRESGKLLRPSRPSRGLRDHLRAFEACRLRARQLTHAPNEADPYPGSRLALAALVTVSVRAVASSVTPCDGRTCGHWGQVPEVNGASARWQCQKLRREVARRIKSG